MFVFPIGKKNSKDFGMYNDGSIFAAVGYLLSTGGSDLPSP
jgi:hypothetical protein